MRLLADGRTRVILLRLTRAACSALLALHAAAGSGAGQDHHHHPPGDASRLGRVEFPTSCAPAVAARFERAVAMLHSFWFEAAEAAFDDVIAADPGCAMAHWGRAMTFMGNPMAQVSPPPAMLNAGAAAAARAAELSATVTPRERLWIEAVQVFFADHESLSHRERALAAERALERLHEEHPEDMEAAIFLGRALVANAPPTDMTFDRQLRAAAIMAPLFARHADHPGLAHYLIHAYDAPPLAEHGLEAAFAYAAIAPDAPHALHMPSHIFTRLGYWDESIETNIRSARAEPDSNAAVHPMDYQVYAYLQQGRDVAAKLVIDRAVGNPDRFYGGLLGYNFTAMPARYALERGAWSEAASLRLPTGALPYVEAVTRFARAVGAARSGAADAAADDVAALTGLAAALDAQGEKEWAVRVRAQQLAAAAWLARARNDETEALRLAAAAADLEDSVEKNPVMPGPILPARELKADLLMELGNAAGALSEYERTLQREPRRGRALFGAARAAEAAGDTERAASHYRQLIEVMRDADAARPEPAAARRFLGG